MLIQILLIALLAACGKHQDSHPIESKIYGGSKLNSKEWRAVVALTSRKKGQICSGVAISTNIVLTAAHCLMEFTNVIQELTIHVGTGRDNKYVGKYAVHDYHVHPKYEPNDNDSPYDFAFIQLAKNIPLQKHEIIKPISIHESLHILSTHQEITLVGFGERDNGKRGSKTSTTSYIWKIQENEFYAGGGYRDSCYGDSGGPAFTMLANGSVRLLGITSRPAHGKNCGYGTIFGTILSATDWLHDYNILGQ